jgi:DNA-binding IclR family transcriptional regulator
LSDLAQTTSLSLPTAHRLLAVLARFGLIEQDAQTRRYHLGIELLRLGNLAGRRFSIVGLARDEVSHLAETTGDTVFMSIRDHDESVCVDRRVGSFPIKTLTLEIGDRRPLGVGSGSLALLAALGDDEIERILADDKSRASHYPQFHASTLRRLVQAARREGFAFNDGRIVSGMSAVGVPVLDGSGQPLAALSIAAINARMDRTRRHAVAAKLKEASQRIQQRLVQRPAAQLVTANR